MVKDLGSPTHTTMPFVFSKNSLRAGANLPRSSLHPNNLENKIMAISQVQRKIIESEASSKAEAERDIRAFEIYEIGKKAHLDHHVVVNAISDESVSLDDFRNTALEHVKKLVDDGHKSQVTDRFSMRQFILDKSEGRDISGANREVIDTEYAKERGREPVTGVLLPRSVFKPKRTKRDLTAGTDSAGGYTIDQEILDLIEPLDPDLPMLSRVRKTYATKPFSVPRKLSRTQAQWTGETVEPTEQNITFGKIDQKPFNLVGWTSFSRELLMSSSVGIEELVRQDLRMALEIGAEKSILKATGVNQPQGLEANTDIPTITRASASAITEDQLLEADSSVLSSNAVMQSQRNRNQLESGEKNQRIRKASLAWIVSPKSRRLLKSAASLDEGSLWQAGDRGNESVTIHEPGSTRQPRVINYEAYVSTFANDNDLWLANWSEIVVNFFSSPQVIVDPFSLSTAGIIRVTVSQFMDFHIRHADSVVRLSA